jgi:hypothetical protein
VDSQGTVVDEVGPTWVVLLSMARDLTVVCVCASAGGKTHLPEMHVLRLDEGAEHVAVEKVALPGVQHKVAVVDLPRLVYLQHLLAVRSQSHHLHQRFKLVS